VILGFEMNLIATFGQEMDFSTSQQEIDFADPHFGPND
jgi:hypothetical protein